MKKSNTRRKFLKKAAYVVPTIVALGALKTPLKANVASSSIGNIVYADGPTVPSTHQNQDDLVNSLWGTE